MVNARHQLLDHHVHLAAREDAAQAAPLLTVAECPALIEQALERLDCDLNCGDGSRGASALLSLTGRCYRMLDAILADDLVRLGNNGRAT